ncbi:hypothetical protein I4U23_031563 [Adineta vaga]|nr:hypothetical protein I4U23_031563 [Adineta vaga]
MNRVGAMAQVNQIYGEDVVNSQETKWMDKPSGDPSGLAYLKPLNSLLVKQVLPLMPENGDPTKFAIFNDKGEQVYYAFEESHLCQRLWCTQSRGFDLHIVDSANKEVIYLRRSFKYCAGCCWCACSDACRQEITVESPPGTVIGFVTQECSCWYIQYILRDEADQPVLKIVGPDCICDGSCSCCSENNFTLYGTDGVSEIGVIHKVYHGYKAEARSNADTFMIQLPIDLNTRMKAVALGALFLIDFSHFYQAYVK